MSATNKTRKKVNLQNINAAAIITEIDCSNLNEKQNYEFVDHPQHYQNNNGVEVSDLVDGLDFNSGNCIKYVYRAGNKPGSDVLQDLEKAMWYLKRRIAFIKEETPKMKR